MERTGIRYTDNQASGSVFRQTLHGNREFAYHCAVTFLAFYLQIGLSMKEQTALRKTGLMRKGKLPIEQLGKG